MYVRCSFIYICVPMHNAFQSLESTSCLWSRPKVEWDSPPEKDFKHRGLWSSEANERNPSRPTTEILNRERSTSDWEAIPTAPGSNWSNMRPYENPTMFKISLEEELQLVATFCGNYQKGSPNIRLFLDIIQSILFSLSPNRTKSTKLPMNE